jgi:hypothetical protein
LIVFVEVWTLAVQVAVVPLFVPTHVQFHGPLPVTADAVPFEQRFVSGAMKTVPPLLLPQTPLSGASGSNEKVAVTVQSLVMVAVVYVFVWSAPPQPLTDDIK